MVALSMSKILQALALCLVTFIGVGASQAEVVYVPRAVQVTGPVYAIVGPLGQRSQANAGLNANYGFVLTATGVILIDSGASAFSAALLAQAVKMVTQADPLGSEHGLARPPMAGKWLFCRPRGRNSRLGRHCQDPAKIRGATDGKLAAIFSRAIAVHRATSCQQGARRA